MPNHCTNRLTIIGDVTELLKMAAMPDANGQAGHQFTFNAFIPMPENILRGNVQIDEKKPNWYNWSIKHWGTKWDAYDCTVYHTDDGAVIQFNTAWSPPVPVINKIAKLFPQLSIVHEYIDEGWGFAGEARYEDGKSVQAFSDDKGEEYIRCMAIELTGWNQDDEE